MDSQRWRQIEALFEQARHLDTEGRERLLSDPGEVPGDVVDEVRRLLVAESEAGDFLSAPPSDVSLRGLAPDEPQAAELVGRRVGAYRLIEPIGSGGMGTVYLAERADAAFEKRVAVKLIKRGMDTDEILHRFRVERQVLANLEHPYIQSLLDGGTTDDGLPFLVTEYIEGEHIDAYCDAHRLPVGARLELFRKVCDAVQYAHQKLVVHRDLKPSNILVTKDGVPKLLDFGIAKILTSNPSAFGVTTLARRPLTPDYASPEQIRGQAITTASDVYSLGVVLYRLLTGRGPYHLETPSPAEMERIVCEFEPTKPSAAVTRVESRPRSPRWAPDHSGRGEPRTPQPARPSLAPSARRPRHDRLRRAAQGAGAPLHLGRPAVRGYRAPPEAVCR